MNRSIVVLGCALVLGACASQQPASPVAKKTAEETQPACQATPKALVTKDLAVGEGRDVIPRTGLLVTYTGWLYDGCKADLKGAVFDKWDRPVPFGFIVGAGRVIKGWDEGVAGMKEKGAKRLIVIPPEKAYGEKGVGDKIPPNAALVFEIETIGIGYYPAEPAKQ